MKLHSKILIAGARGMVGSAMVRLLQSRGYNNLLAPNHQELDMCAQDAVRAYLQKERPDVVFIAAAKVGGIYANMTYPAQFLYENLQIASNLIHESYVAGVPRLLFLGSTCIYPREAPQPIPEEALLTSPLEKTNEAYALAKIAGVKLCQFYRQQYGCDYICAMPTNLYGIGDNYHLENSHVIPGMLRRFHQAKEEGAAEVAIWGTGKAQREFLFVDDLAEALFFLLEHYHEALHVNVGSDEEFTIKEVAELVAETVGFEGEIVHDLSKPDGTPRKKSDISRIQKLGWRPKTTLREGLKVAYQDYLMTVLPSGVASESLSQSVESRDSCCRVPSGSV